VLRLEVRVKITPCIVVIPHVVFEFTSTALQQLHQLRIVVGERLTIFTKGLGLGLRVWVWILEFGFGF
jgi:hypothetical protein